MSNQNYLVKMVRLVDFLKKGYKGSSNDLALSMNISRRTLFRYLELLRSCGAEIVYSRSENSYILKNEFNFFDAFFESVL